MKISISKQFSDVPAGRFPSDGDYTGEKFRKEWLVPALQKADKANPVVVDINDVEGCASSQIFRYNKNSRMITSHYEPQFA